MTYGRGPCQKGWLADQADCLRGRGTGKGTAAVGAAQPTRMRRIDNLSAARDRGQWGAGG